MLAKNTKIKILFSFYVVIISLGITLGLINFFVKDNIVNQVIIGKNPVVSTKSIKIYKDPLTVIIDEEDNNEQVNAQEANANVEIKTKKQEIKLPIQEEKKQETIEAKKDTKIEVAQDQINEMTYVAVEDVKSTEETKSIISTQYNGFTTIGNIEIPKTGVNLPILSQVTVEGMKNAPCLLYATGQLNQNGNNLIVGHNFRNGTIFSNNKNLKLGDKIYITTLDGNQIEYTVYDKFITTPEDVSFIKRDTNNKPEITLSCCTDDDEYRTIILARVED